VNVSLPAWCGVTAAACLGALLLTPVPASARLASAALPTWQTNGRVDTLARAGGVVYVGGTFSTVTDTSGRTVGRANAAAFDAATGSVLPWAPRPNGSVHVIKVSGGVVYLGGAFTTVAGAAHLAVAAVSTSGALMPWNASVTGGTVHALVVAGARVYLGGSFTAVDGVPRAYLASLSSSTGALDRAFAARPDGQLWALRGDGSRLVIGGAFRLVSGRAASHIAAVRYSSGALLPWASHPYTADVLGLAESGGVVYAALAGNGGRVVAYSARGGRFRWQTWFDGNAKAVAVAGGVVVVGGHFQNVCAAGSGEPCVDPRPYTHIMSLWPSSGRPAAGFAPNLNSPLGVYGLLGLADRVYVGGDFTQVNHRAQGHVAGFGAPPAPTARPAVTGTAAVGRTLTASRGSWSGLGPLAYAYRWQRCDPATGHCQPIAQATRRTYVVVGADRGSRLRVVVTATGPVGRASAASRSTPAATA
jgi:hypothetical protein